MGPMHQSNVEGNKDSDTEDHAASQQPGPEPTTLEPHHRHEIALRRGGRGKGRGGEEGREGRGGGGGEGRRGGGEGRRGGGEGRRGGGEGRRGGGEGRRGGKGLSISTSQSVTPHLVLTLIVKYCGTQSNTHTQSMPY